MNDWIPTSTEHRPKEEEDCLVTIHGNGNVLSDVIVRCVFSNGKFCMPVNAGGTTTAMIPTNDYAVKAWMPLPAPYKEGLKR